jgi:tight adherence protein B
VDLVSSIVLALLGGAAGVGGLLTLAGFRGRAVLASPSSGTGAAAQHFDRLLLRATLALAGGMTAFWLSQWVVLSVVAAACGWWLPTYLKSRGAYQRELALVEAIATWTEQLRDTLSAANGLEHAIGATSLLAPAPIAGPVERLAARCGYERLTESLRRFADDVDHPMADFVAAALIIAAEKEARDLGALLGHLAESARDEARMRTRVWVGRARSRSAVRIIVAVVITFVIGLLLLNREYLRPYDSTSGQFVLSCVIASFIASFVVMERLGRIAMPQRFVARRIAERDNRFQGSAA